MFLLYLKKKHQNYVPWKSGLIWFVMVRSGFKCGLKRDITIPEFH